MNLEHAMSSLLQKNLILFICENNIIKLIGMKFRNPNIFYKENLS